MNKFKELKAKINLINKIIITNINNLKKSFSKKIFLLAKIIKEQIQNLNKTRQ